jgi:hypothetical protein
VQPTVVVAHSQSITIHKQAFFLWSFASSLFFHGRRKEKHAPSLPTMDSIRNETIEDFYETLVDINAKIPKLSRGIDVKLVAACMDAGVAPFWYDFTPLTLCQLLTLAKQMENEAANAFNIKMQGKTWDRARQQLEYCKMAAKIRPIPTPKGLEKFAERAKEIVDEDAMELDIELSISGPNL